MYVQYLALGMQWGHCLGKGLLSHSQDVSPLPPTTASPGRDGFGWAVGRVLCQASGVPHLVSNLKSPL